MGSIIVAIGTPLYYAISAILLAWHSVIGLVLDPASGWAWTLSIIGLTVTIRALLIPLFVKQINSSRNMQLIQPKVKELQKKYGHDREKLAAETMKLYKDTGTNPFASCLPLLIQMPIFLALFHLLQNAAKGEPKGLLDQIHVDQIEAGSIFGARIADTLTGADNVNAVVLAIVLVITMTVTTFLTQRQLMSKNMPADALSGPYARQQKILLYVLPIVFAVGGIAFPIGLMLYWTTSNIWTMGQQFYVIRNNPAPGTPAAKAKEARDAAKRAAKGLPSTDNVIVVDEVEEPRAASRQQPKRQTKAERKKQGPGTSGR